MTSAALVVDVEGPAAPPRSNGELVFAEPWQGRVFSLTMALVDRGAISYPAFRERLIARISCWERSNPGRADFSYYRCWLEALEQELAERRLVDAGDLAARSVALAVRPPGHDHDHGHHNDHGHGEEDSPGHV